MTARCCSLPRTPTPAIQTSCKVRYWSMEPPLQRATSPSGPLQPWAEMAALAVAPTVNTLGTLSPGQNGPAQLDTGSLTLDGNSTYFVEINGTHARHELRPNERHRQRHHRQLQLGCDVGGGYTPAPGDKIIIIENDSNDPVVGTFYLLPKDRRSTSTGMSLRSVTWAPMAWAMTSC